MKTAIPARIRMSMNMRTRTPTSTHIRIAMSMDMRTSMIIVMRVSTDIATDTQRTLTARATAAVADMQGMDMRVIPMRTARRYPATR